MAEAGGTAAHGLAHFRHYKKVLRLISALDFSFWESQALVSSQCPKA